MKRKPRRTQLRPEEAAAPHGKQRSSSTRKGFLPEVLDRTVIAVPLLRQLDEERAAGDARRVFDVIIDTNLEFRGGLTGARERIVELIEQLTAKLGKDRRRQGVHQHDDNRQYVFAALDGDAIRDLVRLDSRRGDAPIPAAGRAIYHIWPDFELKPLTNRSISTVKADAAHNSFAALGANVVWAVVDSGIDGSHPHFARHGNLDLAAPLAHRDFTESGAPLVDGLGHGTHVAGIIAGQMTRADGRIDATMRLRDENGTPVEAPLDIEAISGMAPRCKLLSLKVLDSDGRGNGTGRSSGIISALQYLHSLNGHGRRILVHGVNLSVGYDFEPEWFACGQSPLCVAVNRLVKSGVVVVVAAGNSGYAFAETVHQGMVAAGMDLTINDPGNADLAITVGSTHRDMPHVYGVSYFSSKGPTGDGRMKPDLLAPGEKIVSCASSGSASSGKGSSKAKARKSRKAVARYREDSGTSMAAPHVSGVIAAFLSIRREFIGRPEDVKRIFLETATDLHRAPYFQGRGLVDLMRAIQSV